MENFWIEKILKSTGINQIFDKIPLDQYLNIISFIIVFILLVGYITNAKRNYYLISFLFLILLSLKYFPKDSNTSIKNSENIIENFKLTVKKDNLFNKMNKDTNISKKNFLGSDSGISPVSNVSNLSDVYPLPMSMIKSELYNENLKLNMNTSFLQNNDQLQYSRNYELTKPAGKDANYKTKIPPIIPPRSLDLDAWKNNDLTTLSVVNSDRNQDLYQSGYMSRHEIPVEQKYQSINSKSKYKTSSNMGIQPDQQQIKENFDTGYQKYQSIDLNKNSFYDSHQHNGSLKRYSDIQMNNSLEINPGDMDTASGYNINNINYNLPTNFTFGNCETNKQYNKNMFTNYIDPNVYVNSQIIEPISSNIGISFDQQFPPTTVHQFKNGDVQFQSWEPRIYSINKYANTYSFDKPEPELSNIFDPRDQGYGDNRRYYYDKLSSTINFAYDDIDAYRRPNYVTRSKIDHLPETGKYGPMDSNAEIQTDNFNINQYAMKSYLDNSLSHRNELQERLLRKRNNELWESRKYPKHTRATRFN